jgi:branched-chain amino acid transport system substrate-binding protein
MQVLQQAIEGTVSIDDAMRADYLHTHSFRTVVGDIRFDKDGEWSEPRMFWTQFQGIEGNGLEQFKDPARQVIILPTRFQSGTLIYPYWKAAG